MRRRRNFKRVGAAAEYLARHVLQMHGIDTASMDRAYDLIAGRRQELWRIEVKGASWSAKAVREAYEFTFMTPDIEAACDVVAFVATKERCVIFQRSAWVDANAYRSPKSYRAKRGIRLPRSLFTAVQEAESLVACFGAAESFDTQAGGQPTDQTQPLLWDHARTPLPGRR